MGRLHLFLDVQRSGRPGPAEAEVLPSACPKADVAHKIHRGSTAEATLVADRQGRKCLLCVESNYIFD